MVNPVDRNYEILRPEQLRPGENILISFAPIVGSVMETLDVALAYRDRDDSLTDLTECMLGLIHTAVEINSLVDQIDGYVKESAAQDAESRINTHLQMLRVNKKILVGTNGDKQWVDAPNETTELEEELSAINCSEITDRAWTSILTGSDLAQDILTDNYDYIENKINTLARSLNLSIPRVEIEIPAPFAQTKDGIVNMKTRLPITQFELNSFIQRGVQKSWNNVTTQNNITKNSRRIIEFLELIKANPESVFADAVKEKYAASIKELSLSFVDNYIGELHEDKVAIPCKKEKRNKRKEQYKKKQEAIDGPIQSEALEITINPIEIPIEDQTITFTDLGQKEILFPWSEDQTNSDVSKLSVAGKDVYIVKAAEKRNQKIADEIKLGTGKNSKGDDVFDATIKNLAIKLANGIMPYQDNSVKRLRMSKTDLRDEYKYSTIWYSFDISPNSPRVYFTVKPAIKSLEENVSDDALTLVIVAETDKAHQIDTLMRFSTLSRRVLRVNGAGSV